MRGPYRTAVTAFREVSSKFAILSKIYISLEHLVNQLWLLEIGGVLAYPIAIKVFWGWEEQMGVTTPQLLVSGIVRAQPKERLALSSVILEVQYRGGCL